jgi:hypothetical protein
LTDSVVGGRIFDTLERKFARTFPRRILRVFSTVIKLLVHARHSAGVYAGVKSFVVIEIFRLFFLARTSFWYALFVLYRHLMLFIM